MKLIRIIMACLCFSLITLTSCNKTTTINEHLELFTEDKKDALFNLGKTIGFEISGTTINNGNTTHYKAAMKGDIVYLYFMEKSGGGWNYMVFKLSSDGSKCTSLTYLDDLSAFGIPIERDSSAFKSGFSTAVNYFYEASQPAIYNYSKFIDYDTILNKRTYKFEYIDLVGNVTRKITSYVEEDYGLTYKIIDEYLNNEEVTSSKEVTITSFKTGNDVVIPNFSFN